jgi:hypothetical protein
MHKFQDIFAKANDEYGQTYSVHHCISTGDTCPIHQLPRTLPLAKQAEEDNAEGRGEIKESAIMLIRKKNGDLWLFVNNQ